MTGHVFGEVYAVGLHAQTLLRAVPFAEPEKRARAEERLLATPAQSTAAVVPIVEPAELSALIPRAWRGQRSRTQFAFLRDPRTRNVSRRTLERVSQLPGVALPEVLTRLLDEHHHFVPVTKVSAVQDVHLVALEWRPRGIGGFVPASWLPDGGHADVARERGPEFVLTLAGSAAEAQDRYHAAMMA